MQTHHNEDVFFAIFMITFKCFDHYLICNFSIVAVNAGINN